MNPSSDIQISKAHQFFAVHCFNQAWTLLDKQGRSPHDEEQMLLLSHASLWHWTQREDCDDQTLSIGYWQIARVYSVLGQADNARQFAGKCLAVSSALAPFYIGYAHEALARAAMIQKNTQEKAFHKDAAQNILSQITDPEERKMLEKDLDTIS